MYGLQKVADLFAWYAKESDANSIDALFERFFGYLTENLHLKRVDQPAAPVVAV
jgi:membrane-bound lytic murein transglycosylase MltF